MKTVLKIAIWFTAAFVGLFLWNITPDFRPVLTWIIAAAIAGYIISIFVGMAIKRVASAELLELHERIELLDRKVTALLRDALEQRRAR
jgi:RsiW-degrading membrane proteinase PrsW (M82 family)